MLGPKHPSTSKPQPENLTSIEFQCYCIPIADYL